VRPLTPSRFENGRSADTIPFQANEDLLWLEETLYKDAHQSPQPTKDAKPISPRVTTGELQLKVERTLEHETIYQNRNEVGSILEASQEISTSSVIQPKELSSTSRLAPTKDNTPNGTMLPSIRHKDAIIERSSANKMVLPDNPFESSIPDSSSDGNPYSDAPASTPTIKISIGSIEVKAQPQPKPKPVRIPQAPRKPKLTLEDYLKKRR